MTEQELKVAGAKARMKTRFVDFFGAIAVFFIFIWLMFFGRCWRGD